MTFRAAVVLAAVLLVWCALCQATTPLRHGWESPAAMMGMHGTYRETPSDGDVAFAADHYATITLGAMCGKLGSFPTIEASVLSVAKRLKAHNPNVQVGMYWRSDFALELADCSSFAPEWAAHPEWRLRNDTGQPIMRGPDYYIDFLNPEAAAFFARVLVNVSTFINGDETAPRPLLDYIYIDGDPIEKIVDHLHPGIGPARSQALVKAMYATYADIQWQLDANGHQQWAILNGLDTAWAATTHVRTGAGGSMFDHWTILQFLHGNNGSFIPDAMDQAFALATSPILANVSTKVKGWPGPIVRQKDQYPPNMHTPTTPAELQRVSAERFNSELAFFLLVADELDYWVYSWFWFWEDYVPGSSVSTVPAQFFPQAKCSLGAPTGRYTRIGKTYTYKRTFAHASVFVDLNNRTASHVSFTNCPKN
eukprot:m.67461 g.67461  ORF g.67461 m.67461 type:complete len:423 (+) comp13831_c0_seq1:1875-3143(+)